MLTRHRNDEARRVLMASLGTSNVYVGAIVPGVIAKSIRHGRRKYHGEVFSNKEQ
jgi:hypothetical protein